MLHFIIMNADQLLCDVEVSLKKGILALKPWRFKAPIVQIRSFFPITIQDLKRLLKIIRQTALYYIFNLSIKFSKWFWPRHSLFFVFMNFRRPKLIIDFVGQKCCEWEDFSLSNKHTHTHFYELILTSLLSLSLSLSLSLTHTLFEFILAFPLSLSISVSISLTHTHTHTHFNEHLLVLPLSISLTHTLFYKLILAFTPSLTHYVSLALSGSKLSILISFKKITALTIKRPQNRFSPLLT